jgi:Na+/H+ antiporter NhaD/arsenite permease-like protein
MTPITVRIALTLRMNPLALLMPAVFASNVAGVSTLVGTPTNILIGSFAGISFNDFLINQTPGVLVALIGMLLYCQWLYRKDLAATGQASEQLLKKLEDSAKISQPGNLRKSGWVGLAMLILFVVGESIHLTPSVTALMGATALLVWIRPNIEEMIKAVDWTTLVFFMTLFMVVGAIQEVGLIAQIAVILANIVGENLVLAMIVVIWSSALLSTVIANIPFTAAMLPVIAYLSTTIPGADSKVLFYCLSVGAAMGGNGSLIGASANMVTAGISERAGYPITYAYFLRKGFPVLLITVSLSTLWLLFRFLVLS